MITKALFAQLIVFTVKTIALTWSDRLYQFVFTELRYGQIDDAAVWAKYYKINPISCQIACRAQMAIRQRMNSPGCNPDTMFVLSYL